MTSLTLSVAPPPATALDEAVVLVVRLRNDDTAPVTTSSRLDLLQGDLSVWLGTAGGRPVRVDWPWPVDSGRTEATLAPGQELIGAALLLSASAPLFPDPGDYEVVAGFNPQPGVEVRSAPVTVRRLPVTDEAARVRQRAMEDREVVQSICSMNLVGAAAGGLDLLAAADEAPVAQLLASAVTTITADLPPVMARAADAIGAVAVAAAMAAVLPPGVFPGDERLTALDAVLDTADPTVRALLSGAPTS